MSLNGNGGQAMKNPLNKRLPRELTKDATKYAAIFILMVLLISICSGMRVSNESLKKAYYDSFEKYTLEDGHITLDKPMPAELRSNFEEKAEMRLFDNLYFDETSENGAVIRVYRENDGINLPCLLSGELPTNENEIAVDRVFAKNNDISVGDSITLNKKKLTITGFIALPNYSTLFESNTDSMFDSVNFSVAVMTDSGFDSIESKNIEYNYAWLYNMQPSDDIEAAERSDKFLDIVKDELTDYDEAIVKAQVDELTDKLEKAGEEYGEIYKKNFEDKITEITDNAEKGAEEYAEIYQKSIEAKLTEVSENIQTGTAEYAALMMTTGEKPEKSALSVDVDDYTFALIESAANAALSGTAPEMPSQEELVAHYLEGVEKPSKSDISVDVDDFTFGIIEKSVDAAIRGEEYTAPSEEEFKDAYLSSVRKPEKSELSVELDDFLFGIVEDAADAEINGTEFEMPEDEAFEDEIDKTDIVAVNNYIPRYLNQAVTFSIEDIGGDEAGTLVMCYMMIALIAFIFAVTISNTITSEAGVIGTLRASGYTKGELIRHYMVLPVIVTLAAAVVGNILGYTVLKDFCVDLYLNSYSLTAYQTVWDASAFILSTIIPIVLMLLINLFVLTSKLKLSPLKFLRHDLKKNRNKKAMRLNTKIPFRTRFSLRIFFTNLPGYIVMIVGILFGSVLIAFGDMFPRMLDDYQNIVTRDMISDYQYVLYDCDEAAEVTDDSAEKFAMASYDYTKEGYLTDSISVYGSVKDSKYIHTEIPAGKAMISTGISAKFGLKAGDTITLDEKYKRDTSYTIEVAGVYDYESSLAIFMNIDDFNSTFGNDKNYFTGYFSDSELTELPDDDVATVINASDYTKLSTQLMVSMGGMMGLFKWFGALFFIIVVYVLCKQVIERNFQSISMTKILGFHNSEIALLYIASTSIAVLIGLLISIPFIDVAMKAIFNGYIYTVMTGYIPLSISPVTYAVMFFTGLGCYIVVALLQMCKVAKVSKSEALKNTE